MQPIPCALIGLGHISNAHLQAIAACKDGLQLVAVCDPSIEKARKIAQELNVAAYNDPRQLLAQESPELMILCTPNGLHAEQGILATNHGCHVLTEKPIAVTQADAEQLIRACHHHSVNLMVVMQLRFLPTVLALKRCIDEGRLGRIYFAQCNLFWTRPQSFYDESKWRGSRKLDGGMFVNQGIHYLDLMQWMLGEVESVQSISATLGRSIETEDTGAVLLKWRSGTIGSFNETMLTYPKNMETSLTILGEKGSVRLAGNGLNQFTHWEVEGGLPRPETVENFHAHTAYYQHVVRVLRHGEPPLVSGEESMKSLQLVAAIHEASLPDRIVPIVLNRYKSISIGT